MKKIRESFHRIAAAVFCLIMSMKAGLFPGMGQAVMAGTENKKYMSGMPYYAAGNVTASSMYRILFRGNYVIKKVFFWLKGPGDRSGALLKIPLLC